MNLRSLQRHWNSLAKQDPLRAILTRSESRKDVPWDAERFFESGVVEVDLVLRRVQEIRPLVRRGRALDFGCGVGRLTQALATHFDQVFGVDISPAMIERARGYNRHGSRCAYVVNESADLSRFRDGQFDFIYSSITLQHMPKRFAKRYIAEFMRVLDRDGLLLFQLPSRRRGRWGWLRSAALSIADPLLHPFAPRVVMRGIPKQEVVDLLVQNGGEVLDIAPDQSAGPEWESYRYACGFRSPSGFLSQR